MSSITIPGIHHITAIAGDPQRNIDFYTGILGQRLVKQTVNFDDPGAYHLYFGDEVGTPGTILTFFAWPGAPRGRWGTGQIVAISFAIPADSLTYWSNRLQEHGVNVKGPVTRFGEQVLSFTDPDGLTLELITHQQPEQRHIWQHGPIPSEHAIRGFHSLTLAEAGQEVTAAMLTDVLGFQPLAPEGNRYRYTVGQGAYVDVLSLARETRGRIAVGTVHHVAWRATDDAQQLAWRQDLLDQGSDVTPVLDRQYFHSIYFREPGGVLFEIATDPPGFTRDEPVEELGSHLKLPSWLEVERAQIEQVLPPIHIPASNEETRQS